MTVQLEQRAQIDLDTLRRVALEGEGVSLAPAARERIAAAHVSFERFVEEHRDSFIYGVTSGWGPQASEPMTIEQARRQRVPGAPWGPLSFGGEPLPESLSRAYVLADLALILDGHTGMHLGQADAIVALLDGPLPRLPSRGLTAAGEILAQFVIFDDLAADEAWGLSTGLANGGVLAAAMAGVTAVLADRRRALCEQLFALSIEAFAAPLEAYDPALAGLWGDPHDAAALGAIQTLLAGASSTTRRPFQAPVSYRIVPRVLGQARRATQALTEVAEGALASAIANPVFLPATAQQPTPVVLSTGGFHNHLPAAALDAMSAAWVDIGSLAHRHAIKLHRGDVSGLPDRLWPPDADSESRFSTTYLEYLPNDFVEEMRRLSQPTLLSGGAVAASLQDDVAVPTPQAYSSERRVAACLDDTLTVLAAIASQALWVTGRSPAPPLAPLLELIRETCPPVTSRRALGDDCARLAARLTAAIERGEEWLDHSSRSGPAVK